MSQEQQDKSNQNLFKLATSTLDNPFSQEPGQIRLESLHPMVHEKPFELESNFMDGDEQMDFDLKGNTPLQNFIVEESHIAQDDNCKMKDDQRLKMHEVGKLENSKQMGQMTIEEDSSQQMTLLAESNKMVSIDTKLIPQVHQQAEMDKLQNLMIDSIEENQTKKIIGTEGSLMIDKKTNSNEQNHQAVSEIKENQINQERCFDEQKIALSQGENWRALPAYIIPAVTDPMQRIQEYHLQLDHSQASQRHPQEHQSPQQHQSHRYDINPSITIEQSHCPNILLEAKQQKRQTFEPHQIKLFPQYLGNILDQKQQFTGSDYSSDQCVKRESNESIQGDVQQLSKVLLQKLQGNMQNQSQGEHKVKTDGAQGKFVTQMHNSGYDSNFYDLTVKAYIQHIADQQNQAQHLKQRYGQSIQSESQHYLFKQKPAPKIIKFPFEEFSQNEQQKTALKQFYGQQKQQQPNEVPNQRLLQQFKYEHYELLPQFVSSPETETFNKYILNMERTLVDQYELCKFNEDRVCSGSQQGKLQGGQTEIKEIKPSITYKQSKGNVLIQFDRFTESSSQYRSCFGSQGIPQLNQHASKHQLSKRQQKPEIMPQTQPKSLKSQLISIDQAPQPIEEQPHYLYNHNQISPNVLSQQFLASKTQQSTKQHQLEHRPISNGQLSENTQKNNHISTVSDKLTHVTFERQQQLPKPDQMSSQNHQPFSPNSVQKPIVNEIIIDEADNDTPVFGQDNNFAAFGQPPEKTLVNDELTSHNVNNELASQNVTNQEPILDLTHKSTVQQKIQEEKPQQENYVRIPQDQKPIEHTSGQVDVNISATSNHAYEKLPENIPDETHTISHTSQEQQENLPKYIIPHIQETTVIETPKPNIANQVPQTSQQVLPSIQNMTAEQLRQFIKNNMPKKPTQTHHHTQTHNTETFVAKPIASAPEPQQTVQTVLQNISSQVQKQSQIIELQQDEPVFVEFSSHQVPKSVITTDFSGQKHTDTQLQEKQPIQSVIDQDKSLSQSNCQERSLSASEAQFIEAQTPTFISHQVTTNNNAIVLEDNENSNSGNNNRNTGNHNNETEDPNATTEQPVIPSSEQPIQSKLTTSQKQIIQIDLQDSEESIEVPLKPLEPNSQQKDNVEEVVAPPEDPQVKPPPVVSATEIRNVLLQTYPTLVEVIKAASDEQILGLYFELTTGKEQSSSNQGTNPSNTVETPPLQQTTPIPQQTTNAPNSQQVAISQVPETIALEEAQPQQQPATEQFKPSLTYEELQVIIQTLLESNTDNPELKGQLEKLSREELLELYQEGLRESANIATNENASNSANNSTPATDRKKRKNDKKADKQIINLEDEEQEQRNNEQRKISYQLVSEPLQSTFQPPKPSTFSYLPIYHQTLLHRHPKQSKPLQLLTVNKTLLTEFILSQDYKKMFTYLNGSNGESVQYVDSVIKEIVTTVLSKVLGKNAEVQTGLEIVKRQGEPVNVNAINKAIFVPSKAASGKQVTLPTISLQTKTDIVPYIAVPQISTQRKQRILELRKQRFGTKSFEPVTQSSPASLLTRKSFDNKKYRYCLIVEEKEQLDERQSLRLEESIGLEGDKRKRVKVSIEKDESKVMNMLNNFALKTNRMEIQN